MRELHRHALELAREGNWEGAHKLVQDHGDPVSCLIHGYLHRQEGDLGNAGYWYGRAGEVMPDNTLEAEWQRLQERAGA